jgi:hypothetical protein
MAQTISVPGPISGRNYRVRIAGDEPTVDERQQIDAFLRQREAEFAQEYEERFGERLSDEGEGLLNYLGEIPKGLLSGAAGLLESGALGAATLLPEGAELPTREFIRSIGYGAQRRLAPDVGLEDSITRRLSEGVGSFGALLGTAVVNPFAAAGLAVGSGAGEASERARAGDATLEERAQAAGLGAVVGASELIPISFLRVLGRDAVGGIINRIARAGAEGGVEGAQEAAAQIAQNLIEQGIYNPEQGTLEGSGESFAIGAGVGAIVQGLLDLALPRSRAPEAAPPEAPPEVPAGPAQAELFPQSTDLGAAPPAAVLAPGQLQGELFANLPPEQQAELSAAAEQLNLPLEPTSTAQPNLFERATDVAQPVTQTGITTADLDALGVSKTSSVYRRVVAGDVAPQDATDLLQKYAQNPVVRDKKPEVSERVGTFLAARTAAPVTATAPVPAPAPQPERVEPGPVGVGPVSGAPAVAQQPAAGDLGTPRGVEPAAPVGVAVPDRGIGAAPAPAASQPPAVTPLQLALPLEAAATTPPVSPPSSVQAAPPGVPPSPPAVSPASPAPVAAPQGIPGQIVGGQPLPRPAGAAPLTGQAIPAPVFVSRVEPEGRPAAQRRPEPNDPEVVTSLLSRKFTKAEQTFTNPAWAARSYFSKNPNVDQVLEDIAYGFAEAEATLPKDRNGNVKGKAGMYRAQPGDVDAAYYRNTGGQWAVSARRWVAQNMSPLAETRMRRLVLDTLPDFQASDQDLSTRIDLLNAENFKRSQNVAEAADGYVNPKVRAIVGGLDVRVHPNVERALRREDTAGALEGIIATTSDPRLRRVAIALRPTAQRARSVVAPRATMDAVTDVFGIPQSAGLYVPETFDASSGTAQQQEFIDILRGTVVFAEDTGLTNHAVLHELVHAAADAELNNLNSPFTRQIEEMLEQARATMPTTAYGLTNRYEFMTEGMTNPEFLQELATINTPNSRLTLLDRFRNAVLNFVRQITGFPSRKPTTLLDELDAIFNTITSPTFNSAGAGRLVGSSYEAPQVRGKLMNGTATRLADMNPRAKAQFQRILDNTRIPTSARELIVKAAVPLRNLVDMAKPFIPQAEQVFKLIEEHGAVVDRNTRVVQATVNRIGGYLKNNLDKVDTFNDLRLLASLHQVDPRKSRNFYNQFRLYYDKLDSKGDFVERVYQSFDSREARNDAIRKLNATETTTRGRARFGGDPDADKLEIYDKLAPMYRELGPEGQRAYQQALSLFDYFHKETARVLRARVNGLFPGNRARQEQVYGEIYKKIFSDNVLVPYQPLQRKGNFWLSYEARDPETGELALFKESFETEANRAEVIRELTTIQNEGVEINKITPYDAGQRRMQRPQVPLGFAIDVLNTIDAAGLSSDDRGKLQTEITELIFDAAPERSFVQAYRRRQNVRGFLGDLTPRDSRLSRQDTVQLLMEKGFSISRQVADMEYGARMQGVQAEIEQFATEQESRVDLPTDQLLVRNSRTRMYQRLLGDYGSAMNNQRSQWSRTATAGTYGLTLGFNISTAALTFFQFPTVIAPYLAGQHGMRSTTTAMFNAMRVLTGSGNSREQQFIGAEGLETERVQIGRYDFSLNNYDFDDAKNANLDRYRALRDEMDRRGVFNRSITEDILDFDRPDNLFQKLVGISGYMQHHAERYTRETTAIAAYDLELQKIAREEGVVNINDVSPEGKQRAADAAVYTSELTNGTILAAGAPLWAQGDIGAIVYLFKRFGLHMYNLLYTTMRRSFQGLPDANDPNFESAQFDRRAARLQTAGILGSVALFAGAQGLPFYQLVRNLYDLFAEDDEEDFETLTRTSIGELGYNGVINYVTGASIADRIGLSGMFYRDSFRSENLPPLWALAEGIGGPVVGMVNKYTETVAKRASEGDYFRATEAAMPTAVGSLMRAYRYGTAGINTLRGDPIVGDVSPYSATLQAFGFMPVEYRYQLDQNAVGKRIDNTINTQRTNLLRQLNLARRLGDRDAYGNTLAAIREFNARNPQNPITGETIQDSARTYVDATGRMHHGVLFSSRNEAMIRQMLQWGEPTVWN